MQDTIIKDTGNSRTLRSVPEFLTLFPDHQTFGRALIAGAVPIDLGPLNDAGLDVHGTDLNKASLLTDATETAIWGNASNRTVDAALAQLKTLVTTAQNTADGKARIVTGTYTGSYGIPSVGSAYSQDISLPFTPRAVIVFDSINGFQMSAQGSAFGHTTFGGIALNGVQYSAEGYYAIYIYGKGFTVTNYNRNAGNSYQILLCVTGHVYMYIAIE